MGMFITIRMLGTLDAFVRAHWVVSARPRHVPHLLARVPAGDAVPVFAVAGMENSHMANSPRDPE
jgi:hypothetical protein